MYTILFDGRVYTFAGTGMNLDFITRAKKEKVSIYLDQWNVTMCAKNFKKIYDDAEEWLDDEEEQ